jgi:hypothetical protein
MLDAKVDVVVMQVTFLMQMMVAQQPTNHVHAAVHCTMIDEDEEMGDIIMEEGDVDGGVLGNGKAHLIKYAPPQLFDGSPSPLSIPWYCISLVKVLSFIQPNPRLCLHSYIQGGKTQSWSNKAINEIVAGHKPLKKFCDFLTKLEAQFSDPKPDVTAKGKLKVMCQGSMTADEFILEFKLEAS